LTPQNAEPASKKAVKKVACDNHPDREAVRITDGSAYQVLHLCAQCVPADWPKDE
jgi:hypothetical protein